MATAFSNGFEIWDKTIGYCDHVNRSIKRNPSEPYAYHNNGGMANKTSQTSDIDKMSTSAGQIFGLKRGPHDQHSVE